MNHNCNCSAAYGPHAHCTTCGDPEHAYHPCTRCNRMAERIGADGLKWLQDAIRIAVDNHRRLYHSSPTRKRGAAK